MSGIEIGSDPAALYKEFEEQETGVTEPEPEPAKDEQGASGDGLDDDDQAGKDAGSEDKAKQGEDKNRQEGADAAAAGDQDDEEGKAEGVATRDGKHIIPYSVLQSERQRAARAEQLVEEANARLQDLEARIAAGDAGASQGAKPGEGARTDDGSQQDELSDEDLKALEEDFPTVAKQLKRLQAKTEQLEQQLNPVAEKVRSQEQQQARSVADEVQDAIDATPKLAHLQSTDRDAWAQAKELDKLLRANPAYADKSLSERFAKVVELYEAANGPIDIPNPGGTDKPSASASTQDLKKAAQEKARAAAAASGVPTSLSEFPAGEAAASDEVQALETYTPAQLASKLASMTDEQMDAYFANL